jgi:hypothetical protein
MNLLFLFPSIHFRFTVIFISTILASFDCFIIQLNFNEGIQILTIICDTICCGFAAKTFQLKSGRSSLFLLLLNFILFLISCLLFTLHGQDIFAKVSKIFGLLRYLRYLAIFKTEIIIQFQNSLISRILYVLGIFIQCIHLLSCVWFFVACPFTRSTCLSHGESWVSHDVALHIDSDFSVWLRSMYFVLQTLATVGYGDIHVSFGMEMVFAVLLMFFGSVWNGFVISVVTTIMRSLKIASILYQQEINELNNMSKHVSEWNNNRGHFLSNLIDFKRLLFTKQLGIDEEQLISSLPPSLAMNVRKSTLNRFLKNHALLGIFPGLKVETLCVEAIVISLPKEMIYHLPGDSPSSIDSVREGSFCLIPDSGVTDGNHLIVGDCIGQFEYFFRSAFKDTIKADSFVEIVQFRGFFLKSLLNRSSKQNLFSSEQVFLSSRLVLGDNKSENEKHKTIEFNFDSLVSSYEALQQRKATQLQQLNNVQQDKKKNRKLATMMEATSEDKQSAALKAINPTEGVIWIAWNLVLIVVYTFYCVRTPIKIFSLKECSSYASTWLGCLNSSDFSMILDYILDFLVFLHIILSLTIIPIFQTGEVGYLLERDGPLIRKAFFSTQLSYLKLLICFPFELFSVIPGVGCLWCFRAVKILSICLISPLVKEIPILIERYRVKTMTKLQDSLSVVEQLTITLIVITWIGESPFV